MFRQILRRYRWHHFVRIFTYPLVTLVTTPLRLVQSLWSCRILADGRWENILGFTARQGMNSLFYWTMAVNLHRHGRQGESPTVGLGNYPLSRWFLHPLLSLYAFWRLAPIVPLIGMAGWVVSHLLWHDTVPTSWLALLLILAVISSNFYANLFVYQNYNVIGWIFFPAAVYGLMTGSWFTTAVALFIASFASPTVVIIGSALAVVQAVVSVTAGPVLALIPACAKLASHFFHRQAATSAATTMRAIGITRRRARYRRLRQVKWWKPPLIPSVYWTVIYVQFAIVFWAIERQPPWLYLATIVLVAVNANIVRFADPQSLLMTVLTVGTASALQSSSILVLASYWIAVAPFPFMLIFPQHRRVFDVVPICTPYSVDPLVRAMDQFLATVRPGERVLIAFEDPRGVYERLFDGYRYLLEVALYVASRRQIHLMPDFWAVFEINREGAPDFWGRDTAAVLSNVKEWRVDHVIVYQEGTAVDSRWPAAGFEPLAQLDWGSLANEFRDEALYSGPHPVWWLLRAPAGDTVISPEQVEAVAAID